MTRTSNTASSRASSKVPKAPGRLSETVSETDLEGLVLFRRGKVRDIYDLGDRLLVVATDRISAFDVVLPTPIPAKGNVLTRLSEFWFERLQLVADNHFLTCDVGEMPPEARRHRELLEGRAMLVARAKVFPVECVVRGYLAGSAWKEYRETGRVTGIALPAGLVEADALPEMLFTPATKATSGHDENITFEEMQKIVGSSFAQRLRELSLRLFRVARRYLASVGIVLCDTKFEWGYLDGQIVLVDEAFTPDSSRFWPLESYRPGTSPPSFDKQFVRDYLESAGWDKKPPGPRLPEEVVRKTSAKYLEAYRTITGKDLGRG